ncbi:hypothetical protein [Frankia sp. R82]|uniref:hypothetical protein n=1 Tax=Frankia sp. R82 TaxID=2950553 RepID=UPI002042C543|nr:hypothetical protein [Frankia sp. R82]MCM3884160.1 hypothetical protein [Frankia sp. R82]
MPAPTATMTAMDVDALLAQEPQPATHTREGETVGTDQVHPVLRIRVHRQLVPLGVIGTLWAGGAVAASRPDKALPILGLYLSVAILYWWVKGRRAADPYERQRRKRWTTIITVCGTAWLSVASVSSAGGAQAALLLAAGSVMGIPYWIKNRIPVPGTGSRLEPLVTAPAAGSTDVEVDPNPGLWAASVGSPHGMLAGSTLTAEETLPNGALAYTVNLLPGKQSAEQVGSPAVLPLIASGLHRSLAELQPDQHPSGQQNLARILIMKPSGNPLMRVTIHPGLDAAYDLATGTAAFATYADGSHVRWAFYEPKIGMRSGPVFGGTRVGKSTLLELFGKQAASTGFISVWPGCPSGGASFPGLLAGAPFPARSRERMLEQARLAVLIMQIRGALGGLRGEVGKLHVPTPQAPCILLIWDEIHKIFQETWDGRAEIIELARQIVCEGSKFGIGLIAADQTPGTEVFGGNEALRANLWVRQAVMLRTGSTSAGGILPGLTINPASLPEFWPDGSRTQGLGLHTGGQSGAMMRTWWPEGLPTMESLPHPELEPVIAASLGSRWANRLGDAEDERMLNAGRYLANLPADVLAAMAAQEPELAQAARLFQARSTGRAAPATPSAETLEGWWQLPAPPTLNMRAPEHPVLRTPGVRRVHEVVSGGVKKRADIIAHADLAPQTVDAALKALKDAELLLNPSHGVWEKAPAAA